MENRVSIAEQLFIFIPNNHSTHEPVPLLRLYAHQPEKNRALYTGITNDLPRRLDEHFRDYQRGGKSFTAQYFCYNLIYYEIFPWPDLAIAREKEIKGWRREKKDALIARKNPNWEFLNPTGKAIIDINSVLTKT